MTTGSDKFLRASPFIKQLTIAIKILRPSPSVLDTAKLLVVSMGTKQIASSPETLSQLMAFAIPLP